MSNRPDFGAPKVAPELSKRRILIVDDLAFVRTTVIQLLSRVGFSEIVSANNGTEALDILGNGQIDCVLSDHLMPDITGLHLLQRIRTGDLECRRDLPVVLLTGHAERTVVKKAQALDVSGVLVKPCSAKILTQRLELALTTAVPLKSPDFYHQMSGPSLLEEDGADSRDQTPDWLLSDEETSFLTATDLIAARRARET